MSAFVIALAVFFVILIAISILYRNATLDRLVMMEGERVIFEERGVRVSQEGAPDSVLFVNCVVRLTDRRIIIAQKMLFREKYALRHVIGYGERGAVTDLGKTLARGYLIMRIDSGEVRVREESGGETVTIPIPRSALTGGQYISFTISHPEHFQNLA